MTFKIVSDTTIRLAFAPVKLAFRPICGKGYFSSQPELRRNSANGVPIVAEVRVFNHSTATAGDMADHQLVAFTRSNEAGHWRIDGLDETQCYDIICSYAGYNDLIWSGIYPAVSGG